jgi:O-antigen ligase
LFLAFARWPDFFVAHFTVMGAPLIFVKSDVAGGFMVAGVFWFLAKHGQGGKLLWLAFAGINLVGVALSNSRAALVALGVACVWLAACRDWRWLRPIAAMAAAGLLVILVVAAVSDKPWTQSMAYRLCESAASTVDFKGTKSYESADLGDKPDNNLFRTTWWRTVIDETWEKGRWLGLGFGYDLADQFSRIYYADGSEEFTARSPHNFLLTVFGRMGLVGLALLLALLATIAGRTWRAGRKAAQGRTDGTVFLLWLGGWGIFTSACFGVVLEGPMGAVVFWTILGLASATSAAEQEQPEAEDTASRAPTAADSPAAPLPKAGAAV